MSVGSRDRPKRGRAYVIRSCICPMSVESVGWYPTADGIRPRRADTSDPAAGAHEREHRRARDGRSRKRTLGEAENVVDEEEHVLSLVVTEVLGDGETRERNTGTGTRGLVHLSEDEGRLGLVVGELDDSGLDHLVVEVCESFVSHTF